MERRNGYIMLILGASSDLGVQLIRELEKEECVRRQCGGDISGVGRPILLAHYGQNRQVLAELEGACPHLEIRPLQADLALSGEVDGIIGRIGEMGLVPTHIVSFAAARYQYMRLCEWNEELVRKDMDIQFFSLARVFQAFLPQMAKAGYGKVVALLSACTIGEPPKFLANYTSVKYALLGLLKTAAAEYGDQGLNINGISPEMVETKFLVGIGRKVREVNAEKNPRHRNLTVQDVIPSILYLLSDEAEFLNGMNLPLTGRGV